MLWWQSPRTIYVVTESNADTGGPPACYYLLEDASRHFERVVRENLTEENENRDDGDVVLTSQEIEECVKSALKDKVWVGYDYKVELFETELN